MKIGILTFHRARNYGAVLQCYALLSYLTSLGHEVEVVDYYPTVFQDEYSLFSKRRFIKTSFLQKIRMVLYLLLTYVAKKNRITAFENFIHNKLSLSQKTFDENTINIDCYDVLFFGSDQIWNPNLTNGFDRVFTGNINKGNAVFIAYAASTTLDDNYTKDYYKNLYRSIISRFDAVSTRELEFANYLNSFKLKDVVQVMDPVFLLNKEQWEVFSIKPKEIKYLLLYSVPYNKNISNYAKIIAKGKGLQFIEITPIEIPDYNNSTKQKLTPEQFVGYFLHASYVVTSSFHGTAFSILLQKDFVTVLKGSNFDGRAFNLLKRFGLENRAISLNSNNLPSNNIDYKTVGEQLRLQKELSYCFIKNAIDINN